MKAYKNYACHRVYDSYNHYRPQSVVAISENGEVMECMPLMHETSFTEWIGGVIILSPLQAIPTYPDFGTMVKEMTTPAQAPLYAWHIAGFDFSKEELTPQSIIKRL